MPKKRCAFLDRDGVLNIDHHYVYRPEDVELVPHAATLCQTLREWGYLLIVITNQSGLARGYFTIDDMDLCHQRLESLLFKGQRGFDAIYICPHFEHGAIKEFAIPCDCRKPKTGLIHEACNDFHIDLGQSFMVGDKVSDIELAQNIGIPGIQFLRDAADPIHDDASFIATDHEEVLSYLQQRFML